MQFSGKFAFKRGHHRLFEHFDTMSTLVAAVCTAVSCRSGYHEFEDDESGDFQSKQFPTLAVRMPIGSPIRRGLVNGAEAIRTEVDIVPFMAPPRGAFAIETKSTLSQIASLVFQNFYEENLDWLISHFGGKDQFSPLWHFARIVRNSVSHGGTINIKSKSARSGSWHHLQYGPSDDGRRVIGVDLSLADVVILMLELDADLHRLGCPKPAWLRKAPPESFWKFQAPSDR